MLSRQADIRLLKCVLLSTLLHTMLLPLGAIQFGGVQFQQRESVIRVEIEQLESEPMREQPVVSKREVERKITFQKPVKTPQVASRKVTQPRHAIAPVGSRKPPVVQQVPEEAMPHRLKQPVQQPEESIFEHEPKRVAVRPRLEPALHEQPSFEMPTQKTETTREQLVAQRLREQPTSKLMPKFGREHLTMRQDIIPTQAELPSSERTTSRVVEVVRSLTKMTAKPEATTSSPMTLPNVSGIGAERSPGVATPAPQEDELVRIAEAPSGKLGYPTRKELPKPMKAPIAVNVVPPGKGGAKQIGEIDVGGGSGAHGPQRVMIGRPPESGVGLSQPRPMAFGSGTAMEGGGRIGSTLLDQLIGALRPTESVSGVGEGYGGRGGDKLRPGRVVGAGELLQGRGKPTVGGFGGIGGGGAGIGEGAGAGTGAGAGPGAFGMPRSPSRGSGTGVGGEGIGAPQLLGQPEKGGGGSGTGTSGRGYGSGSGYVSGTGPFAGGSGVGSVGRGGGGGMKATPGAPAIGFGSDVSGYRKGVKAGGGSGLGEPPQGTSPKGLLGRPGGKGTQTTPSTGERPQPISGGGGASGTGKTGIATHGMPVKREDVGRRIRFTTIPESTEGGLFTNIGGEFMRHPVIAIVDKSNWDVHINRVHNVLRELNRRTKIRTLEVERKIPLKLEAIKDVPILFIYGEEAFELTEEEAQALREYVRLGGTIYGDSSHGPFDVSFMRQMCKVFGKRMSDWEELPISHPVFNAFYKINAVPPGDLGEDYPILALNIDGRHAVIYSRNDYSDVICDHHPGKVAPPIPPQVKELAIRLNINIVVYALKHWQERQAK
ncbi:MAG: hypothetical protein RUDDFDWM_000201 [Candidatus Fervidibacterota bacterium]